MPDSKTPALCPPDPLREFVAAVARRMGADADVAAELARHLVGSNLAGHDSHGVIRVPQYVGDMDQGLIVPSARPALIRETPVAALVDARRGFGQHSTMFGLEWAMARARQHGVAMVAVRHSTHIGRLGEYAERTAGEGLIGIVTVGAVGDGIGGVVPFGGRTRFLGTNPWALSVPGRARHLIFDAATSTLAEGKVRVARAAGKLWLRTRSWIATGVPHGTPRPSTRAARCCRSAAPSPGTRGTASDSPPRSSGRSA
jgi:uncharacterized oxidoreductase